MKERPAPFYTPEERVELRKMIKMSPTLAAVVAGWAASVIERLLDSLEAAEARAEKAEAERDAARLAANHYTCAASVRNQDVS